MSHKIYTKPLLKGVLILFVLWLLFAGLYFCRPFLLPLAFAGIFAMLLWPICRKLEGWGLNSSLSALISVFVLVGVVVGLFSFLSEQIEGFVTDLPQLQQTFEEKLSQAQEFITDQIGISEQRQQSVLSSGKSVATDLGKQFAASFINITVKTLLMLVYIFLLLLYRARFKNFVLKYTPEAKKEKAHEVILTSANVAKSYLAGRLLLIMILAVFYCVGLSIIGIQQAIFFGILAAILGLIPFIGNIIGAFFPLAMALLNQGTTAAIAVIGLYVVVQLIENYLLEPMIVGKKVNLNAFFAISVVVLGEVVWGLSGAILAMPLLGIAKIIFDNIRALQPIGYLVGDDQDESDEGFGSKLIDKMKGIFGKD